MDPSNSVNLNCYNPNFIFNIYERLDDKTAQAFKSVVCLTYNKSFNDPNTLFPLFISEISEQIKKFSWLSPKSKKELSQLQVKSLASNTNLKENKIDLEDALEDLSDSLSGVDIRRWEIWRLKGMVNLANLRIPIYGRVMGFDPLFSRTFPKYCDAFLIYLEKAAKYFSIEKTISWIDAFEKELADKEKLFISRGLDPKIHAELQDRAVEFRFALNEKAEKQKNMRPIEAASKPPLIPVSVSEGSDSEVSSDISEDDVQGILEDNLLLVDIEEETEEESMVKAKVLSHVLNGQFREAIQVLNLHALAELDDGMNQNKPFIRTCKSLILNSLIDHCSALARNNDKIVVGLKKLIELYHNLPENLYKIHALFFISIFLMRWRVPEKTVMMIIEESFTKEAGVDFWKILKRSLETDVFAWQLPAFVTKFNYKPLDIN